MIAVHQEAQLPAEVYNANGQLAAVDVVGRGVAGRADHPERGTSQSRQVGQRTLFGLFTYSKTGEESTAQLFHVNEPK